MSTKERSEKLAAARKKLKKFQNRNAQKSAAGTTSWPGIALSQTPTLTHSSVPDPSTISLAPPSSHSPITFSLAPPTAPLTNGPTSEWGLLGRPLTPTEQTYSDSLSSVHHSSALSDSCNHSHSEEPLTYSQRSTQVDSRQDQMSLEQQVQAHAQTIDILVSEKSGLQAEVTSLQSELRNRRREVEDLTAHLQSTRRKLEEMEEVRLTLAEEKSQREKALSHVSSHREEMEGTIQRLKAALDDQRQENTELISKVTSHAAELHALQEANTDLQSKLNMAELLMKQLSAESPPPVLHGNSSSNQLDELHADTERLEGLVRSMRGERDQALSDLDALRDAMFQQQQSTSGKMAKLHSRLAESEAERLSLSEQLQEMRQKEELQAESVSSEHAQLQHSSQVAIETLQQERDELQNQLHQQIQDNAHLSQVSEQLQLRLAETERDIEQLREEAVDQKGLLEAISQDKEALSRAVAQNRELKTQLAELQDAFVRLSQQNMQLASDLETERYYVSELQKTMRKEEESRREEGEGEEEEEEEVEEGRKEEGKRKERGVDVSIQTETGEEEEEEEEMELERQQVMALPEYTHLTEQLQAAIGDRDQLSHELQEVIQEREELKQQLQMERREPTPSDQHDSGADTATEELLSTLQGNFTALQQRYVTVMSEKADLVEQLEQKELTIVKLAGETETIGEYVTLYQNQREALKAKSREKDHFIQQLVAEKDVVQAQLHEVQRLMKELLSERPATSTQHTSKYEHPSPPHTPPPPPPPSSLPLHLQPHSYHPPTHPDSLHEPEMLNHPPTPPPPPSSRTAEQIIHLLAQLEGGGRGGVGVGSEVVPCACCTGEIIVV